MLKWSMDYRGSNSSLVQKFLLWCSSRLGEAVNTWSSGGQAVQSRRLNKVSILTHLKPQQVSLKCQSSATLWVLYPIQIMTKFLLTNLWNTQEKFAPDFFDTSCNYIYNCQWKPTMCAGILDRTIRSTCWTCSKTYKYNYLQLQITIRIWL